ncbi:MAG: hypothetical protein R3Y64_09815, partial [Peptostreptococcaceae bacterium]
SMDFTSFDATISFIISFGFDAMIIFLYISVIFTFVVRPVLFIGKVVYNLGVILFDLVGSIKKNRAVKEQVLEQTNSLLDADFDEISKDEFNELKEKIKVIEKSFRVFRR